VTIDSLLHEIAVQEWKLRKAIFHDKEYIKTPNAIQDEPTEHVKPDDQAKKETSTVVVEKGCGCLPVVSFKATGGVINNQAHRFASANIKTGDFLKLKRPHTELPKEAVGQCLRFTEAGLAAVQFMTDYNSGLADDMIVDLTSGFVEKCPAPKKIKVESVTVVLPEGFGYKLTNTNATAHQNIVRAAMYKLLVGCSSGAPNIIAVRADDKFGNGPSVVACCDMKAHTIVFIPYNIDLCTDEPTEAFAKVVMKIKMSENQTVSTPYWFAATDETPGNLGAEPPELPVLNPFWWIPTAVAVDGSTELVYKIEEIEVPLTMSCGRDSVIPTKAGARMPLKLDVPVLTNPSFVAKGSRLVVNGGFTGWVRR